MIPDLPLPAIPIPEPPPPERAPPPNHIAEAVEALQGAVGQVAEGLGRALCALDPALCR